jgi:hypothetical protein
MSLAQRPKKARRIQTRRKRKRRPRKVGVSECNPQMVECIVITAGASDKKKKKASDDEAVEESDDGDEEGREHEYISDSSSRLVENVLLSTDVAA